MTYGLFSIRDHLGSFGAVFGHATEHTAKRYFGRIVTNTDSDAAFSPADFDLYRVGSFDDQSGLVSVVSPPEFVCSGLDVLGVYGHEKL